MFKSKFLGFVKALAGVFHNVIDKNLSVVN